MRVHPIIIYALFFMLSAANLGAVSAHPDEMAEARRWFHAKFQGQQDARPAEAYLIAALKAGVIQRDSVAGRTLRIADKEFMRGLHCPSVGKVTVYLPAPGKSFESLVGVDSNDTGYHDNSLRGSITAAVSVGGKTAFQSEVLREGLPAVPVKANLGGATEFTLELGDAGDGIKWDQADWAEARVTLTDGRTLWLSDLPLGPLRANYTTDLPFSFRFGGQSSAQLLKTWESQESVRQLDEARSEHTRVYKDPKTDLQVRYVAVVYSDLPAVEWTVYFKNTGSAPTPILENIQALDMVLERNGEGEFILHHGKGTPNSPTDYEPLETVLEKESQNRISASGGRPTNTNLCYFNVEWPGEGVIVALGWPGQWAAQFLRSSDQSLSIIAGQEITHLKLLPGEEVRSPLVALLFWKGDWIRSQNLWRRWMIAHNLPRPGGKLPPPQTAAGSNRQYNEMMEANEENQKMFIDRYLEEAIKPDYWWMDAGWYSFEEGWWHTGTWEPDPKRFPRGLRAVSDHAHSKGVKTVVWFEPERVYQGTWLFQHHPEWLLGSEGKEKLLNLGNPEALQWLTNHIDKLITEQGIDLYRQDFNFDPLPYWRYNEAADRQGITENHHVVGYLAYWDELRRRHPHMLIDTCASGGRRNDLETLRRAVPLWRSDYAFDLAGMQQLTYGIALWIPYFGTGVNTFDAYGFRSQMTPALALAWDLRRKDRDYDSLRRLMAQWRQVADYYYGDYYPLLPYTTSDKEWLAWQFDRPESGEGMVQVFRRPKSAYDSARFKLQGLDPAARYKVANLDGAGSTETTGQELMEHGLAVLLSNQPDSAIIIYKRVT